MSDVTATKRERERIGIFIYSLVVLAALIVTAFMYYNGAFNSILPAALPRAALVAGWAGSLGGIAISLKGVYDYRSERPAEDKGDHRLWSSGLMLWHIGRPFSGIVVGLAVFILLKVAVPSGTPSTASIAAVSFILGMRDKQFFEFVQQIASVIVTTPAHNNKTELMETPAPSEPQ
jgi:hypothetical protein